MRNRYFLLIDLLLFAVSVIGAFVLRLDWGFPRAHPEWLPFLAAVLLIKPAVFLLFGVYERFWRFATVPDYLRLALAAVAASAAVALWTLVAVQVGWVPYIARTVMVIDWMLTLLLTTGARLSVRVMAEGVTRPGVEHVARRVVVVGAGRFGTLVARLVRENPQMGMKVVAFVDDDPIKQGKTILGERVIAPTSRLTEVASSVRADEAVVAMPTAPQAVLDDLCRACKDVRLPVRVIPSIQALMTGTLTVEQLRESRPAGTQTLADSGLAFARHAYQRILVTGGAGFIGANFVRHMLANHPDVTIVVFDKLTYAGNPDNLKGLDGDYRDRFRFVRADICDGPAVIQAIKQHDIDAIVNFAAETHVDRSLADPSAFLMTNVYGTYCLLEAVRQCGVGRFHQVSTDEVYGQALRGSFAEGDPFETRSPYSATKASADCLVHAYAVSFDVVATITRGSNSIGPYQYPEKVVPLFVTNAIDGEPLPVYGDGHYVRDYQYVEDHCRGIRLVLDRGVAGEVYNIGGNAEVTSLDLARLILAKLGRPDTLIHLVEDRAGQDRRYSLNCSKVRQIGWQPETTFEQGLDRTIKWYVENEWWWRKAKSGEYKDYFERQLRWRLEKAVASVLSSPGGVGKFPPSAAFPGWRG